MEHELIITYYLKQQPQVMGWKTAFQTYEKEL